MTKYVQVKIYLFTLTCPSQFMETTTLDPISVFWHQNYQTTVMRAFVHVMCASFATITRAYAHISMQCERMRCECAHFSACGANTSMCTHAGLFKCAHRGELMRVRYSTSVITVQSDIEYKCCTCVKICTHAGQRYLVLTGALSQITKILGWTSIRHRFDTFSSIRCLVNVYPTVFAIWNNTFCHE